MELIFSVRKPNHSYIWYEGRFGICSWIFLFSKFFSISLFRLAKTWIYSSFKISNPLEVFLSYKAVFYLVYLSYCAVLWVISNLSYKSYEQSCKRVTTDKTLYCGFKAVASNDARKWRMQLRYASYVIENEKSQRESNVQPTLRYRLSALTNWAQKLQPGPRLQWF